MTTLAEAGRRASVLLVEDNADDIELTRLAAARASSPVVLHVVRDAASCLRFLRHIPPHTQAPLIDLILLDSNLPGHGGPYVLEALREDRALCHVPVVVLTTSAAEQEIVRAYRLGCRSYVVKPFEFERFVEVLDRVLGYWSEIVSMPSGARGHQD